MIKDLNHLNMLAKLIYRRYSAKPINKLSYSCGTSTESLTWETIGGMLRRHAVKFTKSPFQVFHQHGITYTYEEFDQRVDEVSKGLPYSTLSSTLWSL